MISMEAELAEHIMIDLVRQGYSGNDLHEQFRKEVDQVYLAERERLEEIVKAGVSKDVCVP